MKGIILAGGSGTRLYPTTQVISKQLLPIYDKPMIYYPLSTLLLAGIKEILIISTPEDINNYKSLLSDGSSLGISIEYAIQEKPEGLAQAFIIGENFIGKENCALILGDNIFYGYNLDKILIESSKTTDGGLIFGYYVNDPQRYGVASFDNDNKVVSIEEKPKNPHSNYAVTGLYFYDNTVVEKAKSLTPSKRGELEITDLNNLYLKEGKLKLEILDQGMAWLDTGTHDSYLEASNFVSIVEKRQGLKICCPEEIAFKKGYISKQELLNIAKPLSKNNYGKYLIKLIERD